MQKHDVIMTPGSDGMYLDWYQGDSKIEPVTIPSPLYSPCEAGTAEELGTWLNSKW